MKGYRISAMENLVIPAMNSNYVLDDDFTLQKMKNVSNFPGVPRVQDCGHLVLSNSDFI
jgi:hypothetical protein